MEPGFKPQTPQRGEISMSITALMQPMFLPWLHRSNGPGEQETMFRKGFSTPLNGRPRMHAKNSRTGIGTLGGQQVNSNILRLVF
jgi:hypothetical protein